MKKMKTLFIKDKTDLSRVTKKLDNTFSWVFTDNCEASIKYDGTSCAIIDGVLYKRYDAKANPKTGIKKSVPEGAIPCGEFDPITGHHPHWLEVDFKDNSNKYHLEAYKNLISKGKPFDGTYELIGEKVKGNPENVKGHILVRHGLHVIKVKDHSYEGIKNLLISLNKEGLVFRNKVTGEMAKIRLTDFGLKRRKS